MAWKDTTKVNSPQNFTVQRDLENEFIFKLNWDKPVRTAANRSMSGHIDSVYKYAVYRIESAIMPDPNAVIVDARNLVAITGVTTYTDIAPPSSEPYWYFVTSVQRNNIESIPTSPVEAGVVVSNEKYSIRPEEFTLAQNYPNPFNPTTTIEFSMNRASNVSLKVYDLYGRQVATLVEGYRSAGTHRADFDANTFATGIYFYRLDTEMGSMVKKMILLK
jgi:hypothetical protein